MTGAATFGEWLKKKRKALDLTQEDLADHLGCSVWSIQKIEVGNRRPSRQVAELMADYFEIPAVERIAFLEFARGLADERPKNPGKEPPLGHGEHDSGAASATGPRAPTGNLPVQLTSFVGRDVEVPRIRDLMLTSGVRLLTLTGPPGTGKTRLAVQVAAQLLRDFEDGVFFVNLAPIRDPDLVIPEIAMALAVEGGRDEPLFESLKARVRDRHLLLVLDNFEQVVEAAPQVAELLMTAPGLKAVVTSRVPLHIRGEKEFSVPPLQLPDPEHLPPLDRLKGYEAVRLFIQRAKDVSAGFEMSADNAPAVAHICSRLDGLPLAIELAAARVKVLSPQAILARLESRLDLLTGGPRDLPTHQRALASTIEWSYALLDEGEKKLFRRLAVFVGGRTIEAIEAVCALEDDHEFNVLDGIASLVDRSLLWRQEGAGGETRFMMLETIYEYAREKLEEIGEAEELRRRHALHYLALAEEAEKHLQSVEQASWFKRLEMEHNNVKAAISWSLARGEEEVALRFGAALMIFWYNRYPAEGRWWLEGALKGYAGHKTAPALTRARALHSAALALRKTREYAQARSFLEESLRMYRAMDDRPGIAASIHRLADLLSESGTVAERAQAEDLYQESLDRFGELNDKQGMSRVLNSMGERARTDRDYARAIPAYEKSLALGREVGDMQGVATTQTNLAYALYRCGEYERSKALLAESLDIYKKVASAYSVGWALIAWAGIEWVQGQNRKAARLIGAANSLVAPGGAPFDRIDQLDREEIESVIRAGLSDQEWRQAQEESRGMSMDQVIDYALHES